MVKIILSIAIVFFLGTSLSAQTSVKQVTPKTAKSDLKFLDNISIDAVTVPATVENIPVKTENVKQNVKPQLAVMKEPVAENKLAVENANALQFKYSLLLDVEVEMIKNIPLFRVIDEWVGTRYRMGGTSKSGIDCSGFMQVLFTALYGISLPRTAKEQYDYSRRISRTELKEGDLLFFHTTRSGVSHVGMYLTNNKFVHASVNGVTISSLFDDYYAKRLVGVGRVDAQLSQPVLTSKP